ncbi:MAG: PD-(D/E)XK nuclease family protein [Deltaproteobacteria bacterium]|nr:PD-(D/E)XK nuclease family protein [Deltaproteobacteria bacterium]
MTGDGGAGLHPIRVGRGARQVEAALLAELTEAAEAGRRDPALLAQPVRVIVPSNSLRRHLSAALMRLTGRAVAGLTIQTLHGVALEIVERGAAVDPSGDALFPILVRRFAREESALRERLDDLSDGYGVVADDVTDLLDAGFTPDHQAAMIDLLGERAGTRELAARSSATVRVATRTLAALSELGVGHRAMLLARAREVLVHDAEHALPTRRLFVHGFAEATGLRSELLEDLVRHCGAEVFFDEPPDPANLADHAGDWPFSRRLRDRLAGVAGLERLADPIDTGELVTLCAPGAEAEVRAVAERILALVDAGQQPERIAVVARDLGSYRSPLRRHFGRIGLAFSGVGERGSVGAIWRHLQALLELLQRRGRTPADRWLDADLRDGAPSERSDLRLGLRHIGLVRLADVAAFSKPARDIRLPTVGGWQDGGEESDARAERRTLPAASLARAVAQARRLLRSLERMERSDRLGVLLTGIRQLLTDDLGWDAEDDACRAVFGHIDDLVADLPGEFALDYDDFLTLLRSAFKDVGSQAIGGAGGGVQVLSVMDARACTFDAIFVLGMNRDVFPRIIRPDPLLPDPVRRALSEVLPDLPIKATGYDEERFLFAQLLSASTAVTLSWQTMTDAGRECAPSTLVERLAWAGVDVDPQPAPVWLAERAGGCFTPDERLTLAGLSPQRSAWAVALPSALEELDESLPEAARSGAADVAASARLAAFDAINPARDREDLYSPVFGFAGAVSGSEDPRSAAPYVTTFERMAKCPWQTFLEKLLRVEAPPDPLLALPGSDPRLLGLVVHDALERVVALLLPEAPSRLDEAGDADAVRVPWPDAEVLDALLYGAARQALDAEGIALRGLERVLVEQARPMLERARQFDWAPNGGGVEVLGAEMDGSVIRHDVDGRSRELRFRVDRVDIVDGARILTDYKTGRPISDAKGADTRGRHFLTGVQQGVNLQAVAYALAAGERGQGRYLFLRPDLSSPSAEFRASSRQPEFVEAFDATLASVFEAWDRGVFFPRLFEAGFEKENSACEYCEVAIACVRGDSGVRLRMERGVRAVAAADPESLDAPLRALRALWSLREHKATSAPRTLDE